MQRWKLSRSGIINSDWNSEFKYTFPRNPTKSTKSWQTTSTAGRKWNTCGSYLKGIIRGSMNSDNLDVFRYNWIMSSSWSTLTASRWPSTSSSKTMDSRRFNRWRTAIKCATPSINSNTSIPKERQNHHPVATRCRRLASFRRQMQTRSWQNHSLSSSTMPTPPWTT